MIIWQLMAQGVGHIPGPVVDGSTLGFLRLGTNDIWGSIILCSGWLSCALQDVQQHSWSLLIRCWQHPTPQFVATKNISRYCQMPTRIMPFNPPNIMLETVLLSPRDQGETPEMKRLDGLSKVISYIIWGSECPNHKTKWSIRTNLCALLVKKQQFLALMCFFTYPSPDHTGSFITPFFSTNITS